MFERGTLCKIVSRQVYILEPLQLGTNPFFFFLSFFLLYCSWPFYEHPDVQDAITETMQPVAEKLAGQKLQFSGLFGVREYKKGAFVQMHFDM